MSHDHLLHLLESCVEEAAPALLGCDLVMGKCRARLVEVEAYRGSDDPASHAFRGPTPRNALMFGQPGYAYIYLNYGVHWLLNITAHAEGEGAGILFRAAEPIDGIEEMKERRKTDMLSNLLSGPGKLTQALGVGPAHNGHFLLGLDGPVRIEPGSPCSNIVTGPRVGIAVGKGHETPWRFMDGDRLTWVSRPRPAERPVHSTGWES